MIIAVVTTRAEVFRSTVRVRRGKVSGVKKNERECEEVRIWKIGSVTRIIRKGSIDPIVLTVRIGRWPRDMERVIQNRGSVEWRVTRTQFSF